MNMSCDRRSRYYSSPGSDQTPEWVESTIRATTKEGCFIPATSSPIWYLPRYSWSWDLLPLTMMVSTFSRSSSNSVILRCIFPRSGLTLLFRHLDATPSPCLSLNRSSPVPRLLLSLKLLYLRTLLLCAQVRACALSLFIVRPGRASAC